MTNDLIAASANFNHYLPRREQIQRGGESFIEYDLQLSVGNIAAGYPYQLRGWPVSGDQLYKIAVFADNYDTLLLGCLKYCSISSVTQSQCPQRKRFNMKLFDKPCCKQRRELSVNPEFHAASRTMSDLRAANCRQARMSSRSRSGKSVRISLISTPSPSISRMSLTRIRMPRMQGRTPHLPGSMVIRSSRFAFKISSQETV